MATEMHVLFRGKLPGKAALTRAMYELGFPLSIRPATGSLEQQSNFMPMRLYREVMVVTAVHDHAARLHSDRLLAEAFDLQGCE
jgi:hypothetical protein